MTPDELERIFGRPVVQIVGDLVGLPRDTAILSPEEAFQLLGLKRTVGYELLQTGVLPAKKLRGKWAIPTPLLLLWLLTPNQPEDPPEQLEIVR